MRCVVSGFAAQKYTVKDGCKERIETIGTFIHHPYDMDPKRSDIKKLRSLKLSSDIPDDALRVVAFDQSTCQGLVCGYYNKLVQCR